MKILIAHSKKYGNQPIQIDDSDFNTLSKCHWILVRRVNKDGSLLQYAYTHKYVDKIRVKQSIHRYVLGLIDPKVICDHADRNGLNNQRQNLRIATYSQNSQNKSVCRRNIAGFKGVVMNYENKYRKYCAVIISNGKRIFGGGFKTAIEAAFKWNEMSREHHGEFAYQNKVSAIKYVDGTMYSHERIYGHVVELVRYFAKPYRKRT